METREWRWIDKSEWSDGPWQSEPDKMQWQDEQTGLPCIIRRAGGIGSLCGYVGVPYGHPWFGKDYCDIESDVEVHGGLTYASACDEDDKEQGICHVAEDGIKRWWLGFDAGHAWDIAPAMEMREKKLGFAPMRIKDQNYRTIEYMKNECKQLAFQIKAHA